MDALNQESVIPDVLDTTPQGCLKIKYPSGVQVELGKELTPTQVQSLPSFDYNATAPLYTLAMVDPDAPSRKEPMMREILHYLVVNIPANSVDKGDTLAEYIGAGAPKGTGLHRYIFVLYEQKAGKITSSIKIPKNSREGRVKFSLRKFAKEHNLGEPVAANFFQAQYDDYVPQLHKQLSGA